MIRGFAAVLRLDGSSSSSLWKAVAVQMQWGAADSQLTSVDEMVDGLIDRMGGVVWTAAIACSHWPPDSLIVIRIEDGNWRSIDLFQLTERLMA